MTSFMRAALVSILLVIALGLPLNAEAVSTFTWDGPWNVALLPNCIPMGPNCQPFAPFGERAFGASAIQDGQILNTAADTAVAKSTWSATFASDGGSTGLTFSRQFLLSGAPQEWAVSLNGLLNGQISGLGGNSAFVTASTSITPSLGVTFSLETPPNQNGVVNQAQTQTATLADGLYTITGSLIAGAAGGSGVSFSAFFGSINSIPSGFQVSVAAAAVPEPSSLILIATGLATMAWCSRRIGRLSAG